MTPELKDKFITNLIALPAMNSARFMTICGVLAMVWVGLPPDQQAAVIAHLPLPAWALPIIATIIGLAVRVWPQATLTPPTAVVTDPAPAADPVAPAPEVLPVLAEIAEAPPKPAEPEDKFITAFKLLYPESSPAALTRLQRLATKLAENADSTAAANAQTAALRDKFHAEAAP